MRFQTAQLDAYLTDDLWLRNARKANDTAVRLRDGLAGVPGVDICGDLQANILFCSFPAGLSAALHKRGYLFYDDRWEPGTVRLVTSFAHQDADIDNFLDAVRSMAS
jgi:threonine aldolase